MRKPRYWLRTHVSTQSIASSVLAAISCQLLSSAVSVILDYQDVPFPSFLFFFILIRPYKTYRLTFGLFTMVGRPKTLLNIATPKTVKA